MDYFPWLLAVAVVGVIWWHALGARAIARRAALRACDDAQVTFIDELAFKGLRVGRDAHGRWRVKRFYAFEFYRRGDRRYGGHIEMHGQRVVRLQFEPYPL